MSGSLRPSLPGGRRQIHLTGFMGSGKSTVGRLLARRLEWSFLDLDGVIERHEGRSVARIFADSGEAAFRAAEHHVLRQVVAKPATVVALGGGTLLDERNRRLCAQHAVVVWLRCCLETLATRVPEGDDRRPLWADRQALRERYAERLPGYQAADIVIDADAEPAAVTAAVLAAVAAGS